MKQKEQLNQQDSKLHDSKLLIVIPTYNEAENITNLVAAVFHSNPSAHVLFVDDSSQDGTRELIAQEASKRPEQVFILKRPGKLGLGTAYIDGFTWGLEKDYSHFQEMDADLSHDPKMVAEFLGRLEAGCDVVVGSRYVPGGGTKNWGLIRKLISRGGSLYARTILGLKVRDLTGGYNLWTREVLERIGLSDVKSEGYAFQIELKYRAHKRGFNIEEFPILFVDRRAGYSKMNTSIVFEAMVRVLKLPFIVK